MNFISSLFFVVNFICLTSSNIAYAKWSKQKNDQLKVEFGITVPRYNFEIKAPKDISSEVAKYEPHAPSKTSLSFAYRNLAASVSTSNPTKKEDEVNYGTSSATDFQIRLFGKRTYEFYYQSYKGYYIKNSEDLDGSYVGVPQKILRPDLQTQNYGLNFYWNVNDEDFSQAVAFDQSGVQKESAWGFSWLLHASESKIEDPEVAFIPSTASSSFGTLAPINSLRRQTYAAGVGIGGIATWAHLYAASLLAIGVGQQHATLQSPAGEPFSYDTTGTYLSFRFGMGYNGERNVLGIQLITDGVNTPVGKGEITGSQLELGVFYAFRFEGVNMRPLNWVSSWLD